MPHNPSRQYMAVGQPEDLTQLRGMPDGPMLFVEEFGCEVGTYAKRRSDLEPPVYANVACLMYHVPFAFRGPYVPDVLANYTGRRIRELRWQIRRFTM